MYQTTYTVYACPNSSTPLPASKFAGVLHQQAYYITEQVELSTTEHMSVICLNGVEANMLTITCTPPLTPHYVTCDISRQRLISKLFSNKTTDATDSPINDIFVSYQRR